MTDETELPPITELKSRQRRVLGVLVEKAYTTAEYYPLTFKALATGCNQKSNRWPVFELTEEDVEETVEQLGELGLAAVVHPESGRTERVRHLMRKRFTLTEPQLAILTELLLRGRQQLGELRSRASRMVPIDSLEQLRTELAGLMKMNFVQAGGPLDRRGVEVDHALYTDREQEKQLPAQAAVPDDRADEFTPPSSSVDVRTSAGGAERESLQGELRQLRAENAELRELFAELQRTVDGLERDVAELKRDLGA